MPSVMTPPPRPATVAPTPTLATARQSCHFSTCTECIAAASTCRWCAVDVHGPYAGVCSDVITGCGSMRSVDTCPSFLQWRTGTIISTSPPHHATLSSRGSDSTALIVGLVVAALCIVVGKRHSRRLSLPHCPNSHCGSGAIHATHTA